MPATLAKGRPTVIIYCSPHVLQSTHLAGRAVGDLGVQGRAGRAGRRACQSRRSPSKRRIHAADASLLDLAIIEEVDSAVVCRALRAAGVDLARLRGFQGARPLVVRRFSAGAFFSGPRRLVKRPFPELVYQKTARLRLFIRLATRP